MTPAEGKRTCHENEVEHELCAAERESVTTAERYAHDEIMEELRFRIAALQHTR